MAVDAGTIYSEVRIALDKLSADVKATQVQFDKIAKGSGTTSTNTKNNFTKAFDGIKLGAIAAFAGVTIAVKKAISVFADFEQSLANVGAVSGADAEQMAQLKKAAEDAGLGTAYTASQAADAMYYLASAGYDTNQIIGALDGTLKLAGATQTDMASTAATLAQTLSAYGLQAEDASRVSNVFAASISSSQATMEKLSASMAYAGPVAGALGKSVEETAAALSELYNAGLDGSQAGTILREVFSYLSDSTGPVITKLEKLGVAFEDVNPATHTLAESIGALQKAGLSAADVMSTFGQRAGPGMLVLLKDGEQALDDMTARITGTNQAAEQYSRQMDTLKGSAVKATSAIQFMAQRIVGDFEPAMRAGLSVVEVVAKAIGQMPPSLQVLLAIFVAGVPAVLGFTNALRLLGITLSVSLGPVSAIVGGIAALTAGMIALDNAVKSSELKRGLQSVKDLLQEGADSGQNIATNIQNVATATGLSVSKVAELAREMGLVSDEMKKQVDSLVAANAERDKEKANTQEILKNNQQIEAELKRNFDYSKGTSDAQKQAAERLGLSVDAMKNMSNVGPGLLDTFKGIAKSHKVSLDYVIDMARRLGVLSSEEDTRLANLQEENFRREQVRKQAEQQQKVSEKELENQKAITDELKKQQAAVEEDYKNAWSLVERTISDSRTEVEKIQEKIDYLNAHPWADGPLEKQRQEALKILNQQLADAIQKQDELTLKGTDTSGYETFAQWRESHIDKLAQYEVNQAQHVADEEAKIIADRKRAFDSLFSTVVGAYGQLVQQLNSLEQSRADNAVAGLKQQEQAEIDAVNASTDSEEEKQSKIKDIQKKYDKLVAQDQYEAQLDAFRRNQAQSVIETTIAGVKATANAIAWGAQFGPVAAAAAGAVVGALYAGMDAAILAQEPPAPPQLATGGIVLPSAGGQVVNVAENGSPELLFNSGPEGKAFIDSFASALSKHMGGQKGGSGQTFILQMDGKTIAQGTAKYFNNGIVRVALK